MVKKKEKEKKRETQIDTQYNTPAHMKQIQQFLTA